MGLLDNLFKGNNRRPKGTYRTRQEGGIMSSLLGAVIGIGLLIVGGPIAAWYAESQHRAEDFGTAIVVESDSDESGYVVVQDTATLNDSLVCPVPLAELEEEILADLDAEELGLEEDDVSDIETTNCIYVSERVEEYNFEVTEQVGDLKKNQVQIRYITDECDSDGTNCEPVYEVEEYDWETLETNEEYAEFALGNYTVTPSGSSNFIGDEDFTEYDTSGIDYVDGYDIGDLRYTYNFLEADQEILVGGVSEDGEITGTYDGEPFVVSTKSYEGTLQDLEAQDAGAKWMLRIVSFLMMVFGAILVVGPLTMLTNVFKVIPFFGKRVDSGIDAVLTFVAGLIGAMLWVLVYLAVLLLKNIWLILIVFLIIGVIVLVLIMKGKKDDDGDNSGSGNSGSGTPAPAQAAPQEAAPVQSAQPAEDTAPQQQ